MDVSEFEITEDGEVFCFGSVWSKQDFVRLFDRWLDSAEPGEYEIKFLSQIGGQHVG